ncbi:hypothetical protein [Ralstonia syzygii]|nr:hypothetical protein [Ralstonia syzygii]CAH0445842.1 hypothetical protein LMG10661_02001 [Ralstonia syzygii subsp. syzygii]
MRILFAPMAHGTHHPHRQGVPDIGRNTLYRKRRKHDIASPGG